MPAAQVWAGAKLGCYLSRDADPPGREYKMHLIYLFIVSPSTLAPRPGELHERPRSLH